MKQRRERIIQKIFILISSLLIVFILHGSWCNQALQVSYINIESENLPTSFDGFRIAQISDLHNTEFGEKNEKLIEELKETRPDIIVITGDMIDSRRTNLEVALEFAEVASEIAPCYYVTGNHESRIDEYEDFEKELIQAKVTVLRNQSVELTRGEESIQLVGVENPSFERNLQDELVVNQTLDELVKGSNTFKILLSHRPELFEVYARYEIDLVFSGHVHGGQIRLPFVGGLFGPNQGFLPQYDGGLYTKNSTNMVVSRGLGNSLFPLRINNRPEIVVVELKK